MQIKVVIHLIVQGTDEIYISKLQFRDTCPQQSCTFQVNLYLLVLNINLHSWVLSKE